MPDFDEEEEERDNTPSDPTTLQQALEDVGRNMGIHSWEERFPIEDLVDDFVDEREEEIKNG